MTGYFEMLERRLDSGSFSYQDMLNLLEVAVEESWKCDNIERISSIANRYFYGMIGCDKRKEVEIVRDLLKNGGYIDMRTVRELTEFVARSQKRLGRPPESAERITGTMLWRIHYQLKDCPI